jgi:hypothetical protein
MAIETSALVRPPPDAAAENDYQSVCDAISASARGRAFLAEYARRHRHADTEVLLAAIDRVETRLRADGTALERLRDDLRMLLIGIRLARPEIDAAGPLTKAAKLTNLLALMEHRIDAMAEGRPASVVLPGETSIAAALAAPAVEPERPPLSVVPRAEEPELPIPKPANTPQRAIALVQIPQPVEPVSAPDLTPPIQANDLRIAASMPEVTFLGAAPPVHVTVEINTPAPFAPPKPAAVAIDEPAAIDIEVPTANVAAAPPPPADRITALMAIMALSEDERTALFT